MLHLKNATPSQLEILKNGKSILYHAKDDMGNWEEKEVIKHNEKYYRIMATNKTITEFIEV